MIVAASSELRLPRIDLASAPDFELGGLRVRPARRQVWMSDRDCRELEPRVMQVLVALAMARGALVSRDQLIDSCWEGRIVGDDSLNRCVVALRRLAKEIEPQPFAIETVARVGYCLMETQLPGSAAAGGALAKRRPRLLPALAATALLAAIVGGLFLQSQQGRSEGPPRLRMAGFQSLSPDLPPLMAARFQEELTSTLEVEDSVLLVSRPPGQGAPKLALSGTIRKAGDELQFTLHLRNERSGASLWSQTFERPVSFALAPRQVASNVSQVLRCGLPGAGPHLGNMSDRQLSHWMQFCQEVWSGEPWAQGRVIDAARRVTAAAPDFSRGWSSLAQYVLPVQTLGAVPDYQALRAESHRAAREALRLDPQNSEAYSALAGAWIDGREWAKMERLLQKALSVRPTECSCEHARYGGTLTIVGRLEEAVDQYRRYHDRQPLTFSSNGHLAEALFLAGRNEEAERVLHKALELWPERDDLLTLKLRSAFWTGRYDDGLSVLENPHFQSSPPQRAALAATFRALKSGGQESRRAAAGMVKALAADPRRNTWTVTVALAGMGEHEAALASVEENAAWVKGFPFAAAFTEARRHPRFAALVHKVGLVRYWRETGRRPDFCKAADAPLLCKAL